MKIRTIFFFYFLAYKFPAEPLQTLNFKSNRIGGMATTAKTDHTRAIREGVEFVVAEFKICKKINSR
jgi:hypothetical protein